MPLSAVCDKMAQLQDKYKQILHLFFLYLGSGKVCLKLSLFFGLCLIMWHEQQSVVLTLTIYDLLIDLNTLKN